MAGALDVLDTLSAKFGDVATAAVNAAGAVASAKVAAEQARAVQGDQSPVDSTSPLQTAHPHVQIPWVWIGAGAVALVGLVLVLRR